jgi:hypothetical protein
MPDTLTQSAWRELYAVQTEVIGVAIVATVGAVASSKPAIISETSLDNQIISGGVGEGGGFELQMLESDLSAAPAEAVAVTCNGSATGKALVLISSKLNNGLWYLTVGDFSTEA